MRLLGKHALSVCVLATLGLAADGRTYLSLPEPFELIRNFATNLLYDLQPTAYTPDSLSTSGEWASRSLWTQDFWKGIEVRNKLEEPGKKWTVHPHSDPHHLEQPYEWKKYIPQARFAMQQRAYLFSNSERKDSIVIRKDEYAEIGDGSGIYMKYVGHKKLDKYLVVWPELMSGLLQLKKLYQSGAYDSKRISIYDDEFEFTTRMLPKDKTPEPLIPPPQHTWDLVPGGAEPGAKPASIRDIYKSLLLMIDRDPEQKKFTFPAIDIGANSLSRVEVAYAVETAILPALLENQWVPSAHLLVNSKLRSNKDGTDIKIHSLYSFTDEENQELQKTSLAKSHPLQHYILSDVLHELSSDSSSDEDSGHDDESNEEESSSGESSSGESSSEESSSEGSSSDDSRSDDSSSEDGDNHAEQAGPNLLTGLYTPPATP